MNTLSAQPGALQGAEDAGLYFRHMAEFVGFTPQDAQAIRESQLIIEKHIPGIVSNFYDNLLRYPPTRKHFLKKDGSVDQEYLRLRMHHLTNFWRRTASGVYDDQYARYVDYVGRAHTSHGADPKVYIPERYVIGQVGFVQHAIGDALRHELHEADPSLERRAVKAWNMLMMVILELLARAYRDEHESEVDHSRLEIDGEAVQQLAVETYERGLGLYREIEYKDVVVAKQEEIPEGERKIVQVDDLSIGVFHHKGKWYAVRNSCLHRGGPIATGCLQGDILTCPWHGYQYDLTDGKFLMDSSVALVTYPVTAQSGEVRVRIPVVTMDSGFIPAEERLEQPGVEIASLQENEFNTRGFDPGQVKKVHYKGQAIAVYNVDGEFYATQDACTHTYGPLSEGELKGNQIICPWHDSCFDVTNGDVRCGPATEPLKTYRVVLDGEIARVEE